MPESKSGALPLGDSPTLKLTAIALDALIAHRSQRMIVQSSRNQPAHGRRELLHYTNCLCFTCELAKHARSRTGHACITKLPQPIEMLPDFRIKPANDRLQVI